jgi:hypothetical protein
MKFPRGEVFSRTEAPLSARGQILEIAKTSAIQMLEEWN